MMNLKRWEIKRKGGGLREEIKGKEKKKRELQKDYKRQKNKKKDIGLSL